MANNYKYSEIYIFPAIFEICDDNIHVSFPDLNNCFSDGKNIKEAVINATEALGNVLYWMEKDKQIIPVASDIRNVSILDNQFVSIIMADMLMVKKEWRMK